MAAAPITYDRFLTEDFFSLVGLQDLPDDQKVEIVDKMNETVLARVYGNIYEELQPAEREELDNISTDAVVQFLNDRGFDVLQLILEEGMRYRIELAQLFEVATAAAETAAVQTAPSAA